MLSRLQSLKAFGGGGGGDSGSILRWIGCAAAAAAVVTEQTTANSAVGHREQQQYTPSHRTAYRCAGSEKATVNDYVANLALSNSSYCSGDNI